MDCLLLNADYRPLSYLPLSTISWHQAVKLSFMDKITIIERYDDWEVHSPSLTIKVPALAITKEYMKYKKSVRFSRKNLYMRDNWTCNYCDEVFEPKDLTIDHVIPLSKGGKTIWENVTTCCSVCNGRKSDSMLFKPLRKPFIPSVGHILPLAAKTWNIRHESWKTYLQYGDMK